MTPSYGLFPVWTFTLTSLRRDSHPEPRVTSYITTSVTYYFFNRRKGTRVHPRCKWSISGLPSFVPTLTGILCGRVLRPPDSDPSVDTPTGVLSDLGGRLYGHFGLSSLTMAYRERFRRNSHRFIHVLFLLSFWPWSFSSGKEDIKGRLREMTLTNRSTVTVSTLGMSRTKVIVSPSLLST